MYGSTCRCASRGLTLRSTSMSLSSLRRTAQSLAWSNSSMRQCTETPSLLTPNASVRNVFTVGVKRSVVPALFPEIEMRSQKLYDQDVGKASGLNVVYDITYVFYSSWPAHPTLSSLCRIPRWSRSDFPVGSTTSWSSGAFSRCVSSYRLYAS